MSLFFQKGKFPQGPVIVLVNNKHGKGYKSTVLIEFVFLYCTVFPAKGKVKAVRPVSFLFFHLIECDALLKSINDYTKVFSRLEKGFGAERTCP